MEKCQVCGSKTTNGICVPCKERLEKEQAKKLNEAAVQSRVEELEVLTQEEADRVEAVFFEYDEEVVLRDGKKYKIPPSKLAKAKRLMSLLKTVNVDVVIMNFLPSGEEGKDKQREDDLYEILEMAFEAYPHVTREYLENNVDVVLAGEIIKVLIGLNGLKK